MQYTLYHNSSELFITLKNLLFTNIKLYIDFKSKNNIIGYKELSFIKEVEVNGFIFTFSF